MVKSTQSTPQRARTRKRAAVTRANPEAKRAAFLAALRETGNVRLSCEAAQIDRKTAYNWRHEDEAFAEQWEEALADGCDLLEQEARRRAVEGVEKPVFQQGREVGRIREYSDALLMFLLKAHNPERFGTRVKSEVSGPGGGPVEFGSIVEYRRAVAEELEREGIVLDP